MTSASSHNPILESTLSPQSAENTCISEFGIDESGEHSSRSLRMSLPHNFGSKRSLRSYITMHHNTLRIANLIGHTELLARLSLNSIGLTSHLNLEPSLRRIAPHTSRQQLEEMRKTITSRPRSASCSDILTRRLPRTANAFLLYRSEHAPAIKIKQPDLTNGEVSKIIGKLWNEEPEHRKTMYSRRAYDLKEAAHIRALALERQQPARPKRSKKN